MRRVVNYKAVGVMMAAGIVLGAAIHFTHSIQVKRNGAALLLAADDAQKQDRDVEALGLLTEYVALFPQDADALARCGILTLKLAKNGRTQIRAFYLLEAALRQDPTRDDVRLRIARIEISWHRLVQARSDLTVLRKAMPRDAELFLLSGRCESEAHDYEKAQEWYEKAYRLNPYDLSICNEYATLLRQHLNQPLEADAVIADMVAANERVAAAHVLAAGYYRNALELDKAQEQLSFAIEKLKAHDALLVLMAVQLAEDTGNEERCRALIAEGRATFPNDQRLARVQARLELRAGHRDLALASLQPTLMSLPPDNEELWLLADTLTSLEDPQAAKVIQRLNRQGVTCATAYFHARREMGRRSWSTARNILLKARSPKLPPYILCAFDLRLAECHHQLGSLDQELACCRRAVEARPSWVPARVALAGSLGATGKTDDAIAEYRLLAPTVPTVRIQLVKQLLVHTLRSEPRDWAEVEQALVDVPKNPQASSELTLLTAEILAARDNVDDARKLVEAERDRDPKQVLPWLFLAGLAQREGKSELEVLDRAEKEIGPRPEWEKARLQYWLSGDKTAAPQHVKEIEDRLTLFHGDDRERVVAALTIAWERLGDVDAARRLWRELAERQPFNPEVRFRLFELALRLHDRNDAEQCLESLQRAEGEGGALVPYAQAVLLLALPHPGEQQIQEAQRLLSKCAGLRPNWSRVPLAQAATLELSRQPEKALKSYWNAYNLGDHRVLVVEKLLELMQQQNRIADAEEFLTKLPERTLLLPQLMRAEAEIALLEGERQDDPSQARNQALKLARKAVAADSSNYRDYLWLGRLSAAAGESAEAEKALRTACTLGEDQTETWTTLILYLARTNPEAAADAIEKAKAKVPKEKLPLVLAPAYESLGKFDLAEKQYLTLAEVLPSNRDAQYSVALFYVRAGEWAKAEAILRPLVERGGDPSEPLAAQARRALAIALASSGNYQRYREALALMDASADKTSREDRQVKALLVAMLPTRRKEAIRQLEELSPDLGGTAPNIRFILAQLYEAEGNWRKARTMMIGLLDQHGRNPLYLSYFVRGLLRHDEAGLAAQWIDRLGQVSKQPFEPTELRARIYHAQGKTTAAVELIEKYAKGKDARLESAALLLDQLGQPARVESLLRDYTASSKEPMTALLLAEHLARHNKLTEALEICERSWQTCRPEFVARTALTCVRLSKVDAEILKKVEKWVKDAQTKNPKSWMLMHFYAELRELARDYDEAIEVNRQILKRQPKDVVAVNNLALLLCLTGKDQAAARELIDKGLEDYGPLVEMLDTRAVIYMRSGQIDSAMRDLQQVVAQEPSAAHYFHFAQCLLAARDRPAALEAFGKAMSLGLNKADLHPLEASALEELHAELDEQ